MQYSTTTSVFTPQTVTRISTAGRFVNDELAANPTRVGASASGRFHQLDGLRAVAVLLVMAHHSISGGMHERLATTHWRFLGDLAFQVSRSGVDLFFVLSGVLLLRPYLRSARRFDAVAYVRRRVERLWPTFLAAWFLSGLALLLVQNSHTWWTARFHHWPRFSLTGWAIQLPIVNFGWNSYNPAWWSLTVEMLFYMSVILLIPLLLHGSRPKMGGMALVVLFVPMSLLGLTRTVLHAPQPIVELLQYSPCFAWGVLLAAVDIPMALAKLALPVGLAWTVAAVLFPAMNIHIGWSLLYAALVAIAVAPKSRLGASLSIPLFVWLGERSYSLFVAHFAVFDAVNASLSRVLPSGAPFFVLSRLAEYAAALFVAMLVFTLVERRFARGLVTANQFWPPTRSWTQPLAS